jgi:uncharacterized protein YukE
MPTKSIDTAAIEEAAMEMKALTAQLTSTLASSRTLINSLNQTWTGQASEALINSYNVFEQKYSQQYQQMLESYTTFLTTIAAQGYQTTEINLQNASSLI